jgi:PAS domain S-box-containing protein
MDQAAESIVIADAIGRIVYANRSAERQVGLPGSELIGRHFIVALAAGVDPVRFDDISRTVGAGETWSGRQVATAANGMPVAVDLVVSPIRDAAGRIANVVAIGRDVSRESSLEGDLAREVRLHAGIVSTLSRLDSSDSVEEKAEHLADSLMDLDGVSLARVVSVGPGDVWYRVAGRGHDSIVLSGSRPSAALMTSIQRRGRTGPWVETARRWASRTRVRSLDAAGISMLAFAPIRHRGSVVGLLVAGSAYRRGTSTLVGHLAAMAELADVGSAMLGSSFVARQRAADVRDVLERIIADAAFQPVYQPIVRLRDGAVLGYEALTRFDDGRAPDMRFAEAAAVGLGFELEIATLEVALQRARAFPGEALLSINVSPAIIVERGRLEEVLVRSNLDREVVLEITEREPIDDYAVLRKAISDMAVPVQWAIDDAGAGFASLRHILELRPQFVKLDRALISDIALDPARQALVAGLLHFSKALGTTLIAEGIETSAERLALEQLGVTAGQGYLFGRPEAAGGATDRRPPDLPDGPDGSPRTGT